MARAPAPRASRPRRRAGGSEDRGSGAVGALAGVVAFVVLLAFAAQLLVTLYARSVVGAAAWEAARAVAADGGPDVAAAERRLRSSLGRFGDDAAVTWSVGTGVVAVRVRARNAMVRVPGVDLGALHEVDRTARARVECVRSETGSCA